MCLEEMLCCTIPEGALYYGEPRRREQVLFTQDLRTTVSQAVEEMHQLYSRGYTPKTKPKKECNSCSLKDICLPVLVSMQSVDEYMKDSLK